MSTQRRVKASVSTATVTSCWGKRPWPRRHFAVWLSGSDITHSLQPVNTDGSITAPLSLSLCVQALMMCTYDIIELLWMLNNKVLMWSHDQCGSCVFCPERFPSPKLKMKCFYMNALSWTLLTIIMLYCCTDVGLPEQRWARHRTSQSVLQNRRRNRRGLEFIIQDVFITITEGCF